MTVLITEILDGGFSITITPESNGIFVAIRKVHSTGIQYVIRAAPDFPRALTLAWDAITTGDGFSSPTQTIYTIAPALPSLVTLGLTKPINRRV